jgi:polyisoprenoid-binding protein YceI
MSARTWKFDLPHCNLQFTARHMVVAKVIGRFDRFDGSLTLDPDHPESGSVTVEIDAASVNTNAPDRDNHLRSPDFLDVAHHPRLSFKSTRVAPDSQTHLTIEGELTLRGITRPVTLDVRRLGMLTDPWGQARILFHARTSLNRSDFDIKWNKALDNGGWLVSERVELDLDVQAVATT